MINENPRRPQESEPKVKIQDSYLASMFARLVRKNHPTEIKVSSEEYRSKIKNLANINTNTNINPTTKSHFTGKKTNREQKGAVDPLDLRTIRDSKGEFIRTQTVEEAYYKQFENENKDFSAVNATSTGDVISKPAKLYKATSADNEEKDTNINMMMNSQTENENLIPISVRNKMKKQM